MEDELIRKRLAQSLRYEARAAIIRRHCRVYGEESAWLSTRSLRERMDSIPIEPELRYLKELGYITQRNGEASEDRMCQATAKGYALWCDDVQDETIFPK